MLSLLICRRFAAVSCMRWKRERILSVRENIKRLLDEYGIPCKGYNFLGLVLAIFNKKINRRKYYCSEFIYKILSDDSVKLFEKTKKIVKPMDFEKIENLKFIYEGKIIDYKLKKLSTLNLFDKVI